MSSMPEHPGSMRTICEYGETLETWTLPTDDATLRDVLTEVFEHWWHDEPL